MEMLNPFGSSKDRAVKQFLTTPAHVSDNELVEASSGSTAISLVQMAHIMNKHVTLYLPNDLAEDKVFSFIFSICFYKHSKLRSSKYLPYQLWIPITSST